MFFVNYISKIIINNNNKNNKYQLLLVSNNKYKWTDENREKNHLRRAK